MPVEQLRRIVAHDPAAREQLEAALRMAGERVWVLRNVARLYREARCGVRRQEPRRARRHRPRVPRRHRAPPLATAGTLRTLHGRHPTDRKRFSSRVATGKPAITGE